MERGENKMVEVEEKTTRIGVQKTREMVADRN